MSSQIESNVLGKRRKKAKIGRNILGKRGNKSLNGWSWGKEQRSGKWSNCWGDYETSTAVKDIQRCVRKSKPNRSRPTQDNHETRVWNFKTFKKSKKINRREY